MPGRHVGVFWGFGRNSGCRASGDHHTPQFVTCVASCARLNGGTSAYTGNRSPEPAFANDTRGESKRITGAKVDALVGDWAQMGTNDADEAEALTALATEDAD
jgi:hypothetical protein